MDNKYGKLYLVATPIGNLQDITLRAIEILKSVDIVACEDTRHTLKLLNKLELKKKLISYFEHNKTEKGEYLIAMLKDGLNIALVTDAGTPAISDPGEDIVKLCIENEITVVPIPGPVAFVCALISSGMDTKSFIFEGFLPVNKKQKRDKIKELINEKRTTIFYEAPHKLESTLLEMFEILGDREVVIAKEITKIYEKFERINLSDSQNYIKNKKPRGEYVLILKGINNDKITNNNLFLDFDIKNNTDEIKKKVNSLISNGMDKKEAIKEVSKSLNIPKREVYSLFNNN